MEFKYVVSFIMAKTKQQTEQTYTMVGYGTFITKRFYSRQKNVRVVTVNGFRRIYDKFIAWYPFVLPDPNGSFKGLAFDVVSDNELRYLDGYEGCGDDPTIDGDGLYFRMPVDIVDTDGSIVKAWIYAPTTKTRVRTRISLETDGKDSWIDVIKEQADLESFPGLVD